MVMAMAAGAVFGLLYGTLLVWVGSSLGQTIAFVIGRCVQGGDGGRVVRRPRGSR